MAITDEPQGLRFTRREGQSFYIGDVQVWITEIRADKVAIVIDAPRHIPVDRAEVREAKARGITTQQLERERTRKDKR